VPPSKAPESFDTLLWVTLRDGVFQMLLIDGPYKFIVTKHGDLSFAVDLPGRVSTAQTIHIPPQNVEQFYSLIRAIIQLRDAGVGLSPGQEKTSDNLRAIRDTDEPGPDGEAG